MYHVIFVEIESHLVKLGTEHDERLRQTPTTKNGAMMTYWLPICLVHHESNCEKTTTWVRRRTGTQTSNHVHG